MYDKKAKRNFGIILSVLGMFLLMMFGIAEIESAVFIIPIGMLIGGIIMIFANMSDDTPAQNTSPSAPATKSPVQVSDEKLLEIELQLKIAYAQEVLEDLNFDLALGLYDGDIYDIAHSDEPYRVLKHYVKEGFPTLSEFKSNYTNTVHILVNGCGLSSEKALRVENRMHKELETLTSQEEVNTIAREFSKGLPDELFFLYGKVNYTLAVINHMKKIAQDNNDLELHNKAMDIEKKRGYAD